MQYLRTTGLLCVISLTAAIAVRLSAADDASAVQIESVDLIEASVSGDLITIWKPEKLIYASVMAGGSEIELDPAGCPDVTRELLEFRKSKGGGFVSAMQVEAEGDLLFEERPASANLRHCNKGDSEAVVPVLRVQSIKITILPNHSGPGSIKRARDKVVSTKVHITKH